MWLVTPDEAAKILREMLETADCVETVNVVFHAAQSYASITTAEERANFQKIETVARKKMEDYK